ncbi:MAG TPA: threonine/serine dehydratase [Candidatus Limnocylindrales bacterium]|nr:threonine/serine dehydratase [Candidatus Limnocylindrales bacterium]
MDGSMPLDDIRAARERHGGRLHRTPILGSETAGRIVAAATGHRPRDGRLLLKAEHLQKTGSFKPRAALNRLASLSEDERKRGAVTMSAGNAGQAYAWAGRAAGVPVTVVMPASAVRSKVDACLGYGADVVLHGADVGETAAEMDRLRDERGLTIVHPFDQPEVIAGNGTLGLEIVEDVPDVDVLVAGIGGGGLIAGVASAVKALRASSRIYGVEPVASDAMSQALTAGMPVPIRPVSVADGLGAPFAGQLTLPIVRALVDDVVLLTDAEILSGVRFGLERLKQVLEPAGAAALAAVLLGRIPVRAGERVVVVLSGGNIALERLGEFLAAAAPLPESAAR